MGIIIETECDNWFLILLELGWFGAIAKNVFSTINAVPEEQGSKAAGAIFSTAVGYYIIKGLSKPICKWSKSRYPPFVGIT